MVPRPIRRNITSPYLCKSEGMSCELARLCGSHRGAGKPVHTADYFHSGVVDGCLQ